MRVDLCVKATLIVASVAACGRVGYELALDDLAPSIDGGVREDAASGGSSAAGGADGAPAGTGGGAPAGTGGSMAGEDGSAGNPDGGVDAMTMDADGSPSPVACTAIPAFGSATPVIDGALDGALPLERFAPTTGVLISGTPPPGHEVWFAAAWQENGLYVFADVRDAAVVADRDTQLYCADAFEIFVDDRGTFTNAPSYDNPGTRQFVIAAPSGASQRKRADVYRQTQLVGAWNGSFIAVPTPTGYAVEAFIQAADLGLAAGAWLLAEGGRIGFTLSVDTAAAGGSGAPACMREAQYTQKRGTLGCMEPHCDVSAFCTPTLAPR